MKGFLDYFKKKGKETGYDVVKSRSGLPLWVIEPLDSWDDPEDELEKDTIKETK